MSQLKHLGWVMLVIGRKFVGFYLISCLLSGALFSVVPAIGQPLEARNDGTLLPAGEGFSSKTTEGFSPKAAEGSSPKTTEGFSLKIAEGASPKTAEGSSSKITEGTSSKPEDGSFTKTGDAYFLQAGDVIDLSVWKEPDLTREILIGPDGFISIPLIGAVEAKNKSLDALRAEIKKRLATVINEPSVNVSLRGVAGSKIFIIGKVARPGEYPMNQPVDVLQALSKAGGVTPFADADEIKIIRRVGQSQTVIRFNYNQVERGKHLEQNVALVSGDTILVP